ncbi:efflux RND transporter periplasmic adaptor subunit [Marinoscillum pacificum]|uniref:efflux RND transporter periplasmic adaptor subunit n=1 Tax=Marinoscillum pacificum TaxID=392723 RepID=UPI0021582BEF|nr:HlyD family efflux transporter periplasmic adaptor subunit [Marinoscillum pacificum]
MISNKRNLAIGAIILVALISFFIWSGSDGSETGDLIVKVDKGEFVVDINTTGELEAISSTEIKGPSKLRNYRVYQVNIQHIIEEGTYVEKGQYVARLDPSDITTRIKDTQLELDEKQSQFEQTQLDTTLQMRQARDNLVNLKYTVEEKRLVLEQSQYEPPATIKKNQMEVDKAIRALKQAEEEYDIKRKQNVAKMQEVTAKLQKVRLELDGMMNLQNEFTIIAPEAGMLIYKKGWDGKPIKEGSQISAWEPTVAILPDLSAMNSVTYVNEVDIRKMDEGQRVDIGLDAFPDKKLTGVVTRVANVGEQRPNSDAKVFELTIKLDAIDETLRPGMTTSNKIYTTVKEDVLSVPLEALHSFADSISYVYVKDGLGYSEQEVELGETNANSAEIISGLKETQEVYLSLPTNSKVELDDIALLDHLNGKRNNDPTNDESASPAKSLSDRGSRRQKPGA